MPGTVRLSKSQFQNFIEEVKAAGGDTAKLEALLLEIEKESPGRPPAGRIKDGRRPEDVEEIKWTPEHEEFKRKLDLLIDGQGLEIHPKFKPKLPSWIDHAINRDCKCVLDETRECPCDDPIKWDCPLLRKA